MNVNIIYCVFHSHATVVGTDIRRSGHWLSTNENVVLVNRITGEAQACGEGVAEGIHTWLKVNYSIP